MTSSAPSQRRPDLDWIRVAAFFLLILYHVGMFYVPWDWHVKSDHPIESLELVMWLTNPWRLTLLFLVSGCATRFMADKLSAGGLAKARLARLAPPLVFAILVIVPPQTYLQVVESAGFHGSFAEFYGKYVTASGHWRQADGSPLLTPTYNHMWFVTYLLIYTLLLCGLLAVARPAFARIEAAMERWMSGWTLLAVPVAVFAGLKVLVAPHFPVTHAVVGDWYEHAVSFGAFLFGFLSARSEVLKQAFIRLRWPALGLAVVGYATFALFAWTYRADGATPSALVSVIGRSAYGLNQWCAIAAVLGFGARHVTRGGPVLSYLTVGVFPFYIIHQTAIVVAAHALKPVHLPQGLEAAILIAVTWTVCFATYELVRRVNVLRPLFGLKPLPRARPVREPAIARAA